MIAHVLIVIAALAFAAVVIVAIQPEDFRITRGAKMGAAPQVVYEQVNDFHQWNAWSPWVKMDPEAKTTFEGAAAGVGAIYKWDGNSKVGAGCMTLMESRPGELIRIKLEFYKPFKATNTAEFTFKAEGNQTLVTWSMSGKSNFVGKAMGLIMNFDKMIGRQFEQGLAAMKAIAEGAAK